MRLTPSVRCIRSGRAGGERRAHPLLVRIGQRAEHDRRLDRDGRAQRRALGLVVAVSQTLQTFALASIAWRMLRGFDVRGILFSGAKVTACSVAMAIALAVVQIYGPPPEPTLISRITVLAEHLLFGAALFLALARIVDSEELHLAIDLLFRRRTRELIPLP